MPAEIFTQQVRRSRAASGVMGVSLGAFAFFALAITKSLSAFLDDITASFPEALKAFVGAGSPGGYVVGETFALIGPIALVAYAVMVGASALAGEERDGTMALLSAQPVSRSRVLAAKAGGMATSLATVAVLFWVGMALALVLFPSSDIGAGALAAGVLHLLFLALAFGSVAFAVGGGTGRPSVAAGAAGGLAVVAYLTQTMLPLAGLGGWAPLSPWHYAMSSDPLRNGVDIANLCVLAGIAVGGLAVGALGFSHRDLRG